MSCKAGLDTVHLFGRLHPADLSSLEWKGVSNWRGIAWDNYTYKNQVVSVSTIGTSCKIGLPNFRHGSNIYLSDPQETKEGIEELSDTLAVDVSLFDSTRIDFALTLVMNTIPSTYYSMLGEMRGLERLVNSNSLYYQNSQEQFVLYDKSLQARKAKMKIPAELVDLNLLRGELRLVKPKRILKRPIPGKSLYDPTFIKILSNRLQKRFDSIQKLFPVRLNMDGIRRPKDFYECLEVYAVSQIGSENIRQMIDELKINRAFPNTKAYQRLHERIKKLAGQNRFSDASPLLEELTRKIRECQ